MIHKVSGIRRPNVLQLQAIAMRTEAAKQVAMDELEDGEEPVRNGKRNGKGRESDSDEDDEEEESDDSDESESSSDDDAMEVDEAQPEGEEEDAALAKKKQTERIVPPDEVRAHLRRLFKNESPILALVYAPHGPLATSILAASPSSSASPFASTSSLRLPRASADIFFLDVIVVPPTRFRPAATMGDQVFENSQNLLLNGILQQTFLVRDYNDAFAAADAITDHKAAAAMMEATGRAPMDKTRIYTLLLESLIGLQVAVNSMVDSTKNPIVLKAGKLAPVGVKQMLEKKDGLFRKNMMVRATLGLSFDLVRTLIWPVFINRVNESITLLDPSFHQISISKRTKLEYRQSLLESSLSLNPSLPTTLLS